MNKRSNITLCKAKSVFALGVFLIFQGACGDEGLRTAAPYSPYATETFLVGPKDTCIVTQYTSNQDAFASIAADNHQAYAYEHGYRAFAFRGRISNERFSDPGHRERLRRDGLYWQKIAAVQDILHRKDETAQRPLCHWVMWLDADAIFTNFERSIEQVLEPYQDNDVVLSQEHMSTVINAGVFFVKNTPAGHAFMDRVASMFPEYKDYDLPEQQAMQDYAFDTQVPTPNPPQLGSLLPRLRPGIAVTPQRTFNSFAIPDLKFNALYSWEQCDFVAHIAATKSHERVRSMHDMIDNRPECAF